ncbi:MAG: FliG C-terminal domain-containing protein [Myxococcales bacterium]|nr:hypothetical protein [Myxococcota bacterium]MDW8282822.1 FliG C-terminal domain-containing protein [Myxococcales bacterium]
MKLTGPEKAACLILSLDEEQAAPLLGRLGEADLQRLQASAQRIQQHRVTSETLRAIYLEFSQVVEGQVPILHGGSEYLAKLIQRAASPAAGPLDELAGDGKLLAEVLSQEHPQTVAAVLSQVDTGVATAVLASMPEELQEQILDRMATIHSISPVAMEATRDTLFTELGDSVTQTEPLSGPARVAAILNTMLPEQSAALLAKIEARSPERAALIRREQFTFEDLGKLDRRGMVVLLREVDAGQLVLALKTASEALREKILSAMSSRAAETIREDLANQGPQRLVDVERAQREILEIAMRLQSEGKLVLATGGQIV